MYAASRMQAQAPAHLTSYWRRDTEFIELLQGYRLRGGLVRAEMLIDDAGAQRQTAVLSMARRIASRELLSFKWHESIWVPMFQFCPASLALRPGVSEIFAELVGAMDDWEIAQWFVTPHVALANVTPLSRIDLDVDELRRVARVDRFVARG
ncbi:hypothetical protein [Variovorax sp. UC122_21]|uniref:hypothetical protein n=1 Tax=Variovorax sp. UC122_21 TaxID=3374554 RepID=UPI003757DF30